MAAIIQFRRDTASNWTSNNPTLADGEFAIETDTDKYKIGDGSTAWTSLNYGTGLGAIDVGTIDAKGDLVVGTADNTAARLAAGSNGQVLVADSGQTGGLKWVSQESIVNWHEAVKLATAGALPNTPTYDNGTSGVGATLTAGANARLSIDGANATTGDRVLVQDQATAAHNGIYDVTNQGVASTTAWILTRAVDFDGAPTGQVKSGDSVYALSGSANSGQGFVVTSTSDPHAIGTDSIAFTQFTGTQAFTAGTGVSISGNTINVGTASSARIVANADDLDLATTAVSAASYGSATAVGTFTVDAYGRLTAASDTTIAVASTAVTDFTEAVQDVSGAQVATNGSHTGISASYDDAGDGAIDLTLTTTGVSAASYGSATAVPGYTVDTYGRLTAAADTTIAIPSTAVTDFTEAVQDVSGAQLATNGSHTGITASYDDAGDGAIDLALVTENVQDIVAGQLVTNGSHSGIAATYDDAGDGAIDLNVDDFTITLGGDLTGNVTITDLASATLTATVAADSVALGTDTTGNYVATVAGTANEIEVSGSGSETAAVTVGLPNDVTIVNATITGVTTLSGTVAGASPLIFEGATADAFETTLAVTDPTADRTITLPNATGTVVTTGNAEALLDGTTATTQSQSDNSTNLATTAYVDTGLGALSSDSLTDADSDTKIQVEESADEDIIRFDTAGVERMSIGATGVVTIVGDLTVGGTTTTINSTTLTVDDKNIELGSVATPSDTTADGGGITLKGASDKTFNWVNATDAWTSSEHVDLASGKGYYIAGSAILTATSLAAGVVLADGVSATTQAADDNTTKVATTAYVQTELGALSSDSITDADSDTKIQVEESADEDKIRFDTAGTERAVMDSTGLDVTGNVLYNIARNTQTGTAYTLVAADRGKIVTMNNAAAQTVTVPPNSSVAYATGTQIQVSGLGAGEVTMAAGTGVTLRYTPGLKLRAQYSSVTCVKIDTDEWLLIGDLEA